MSNVCITRPMTIRQNLCRFVKLGVYREEKFEFYERLVNKMRRHTMLGLRSRDGGGGSAGYYGLYTVSARQTVGTVIRELV